MNSITIVEQDEEGALFTTSEAIAEGAGVEHRAVLQAITKYQADFERFGTVAFEMRPLPGGGNPVRIANLNEQQATLLLTYAKNTEQVRAFKVALVEEFDRMAKALNEQAIQQQIQLPQNYAQALRELADTAEREERERLEKEQERDRRLELEGPAAERDLYRSSAGLQLIGDVANRFKAYAQDRYPDVKVTSTYVWEHAARLGIIIRGNTVRHNQPTAQAVKAGWAKPSESAHETHTRGTVRTVTTRLTPKGESRLWDGLVRYVEEHDQLRMVESKEVSPV